MDITRTSAWRSGSTDSLRRPLFPAIRWGAILAGVVVGIAVQLALTLLGLATGLANVTQGTPESRPLLWSAFNMLVAAFVSGYIAARMSGLKRKADGMLHGAVSWAVTTILFAMFATAGGGGLMSGVLAGMTQPASNGDTTALANEPPVQMDAQSLQRFQSAIRLGDRETAIMILMTSADMDRMRAESLVDQALALSGNGGGTSGSSGGAGSSMRGGGSEMIDVAAWIVFGAVAFALVTGIGGGAVGAAGSRRLAWSGQNVRSAYVAAASDSDGNEDPGA